MLKAYLQQRNNKVGKLQNNEKGFSAVEVILVVVIVALIGVVGWFVYKNHNKTTNLNAATSLSNKPATTTPAKSTTATTQPSNPYAGWKTYHSILNSGLSFMYPPTWSFTPATQTPTPNNLGGVENDSVLYSVAPTTSQGQYAAIPTNVFMCVTFDEYSGNGWSTSNWNLGTPISSQQVNINGKNLTLATYKGTAIVDGNDSSQPSPSMADEMVLFNPSDTGSGDHFIDTNNNYVVSVSAQFNCQQGGFPSGTNLNQGFTQRPETATAKLIIESVKW
jgi:hypothetical protein